MTLVSMTSRIFKGFNFITKSLKKTRKQVPVQPDLTKKECDKTAVEKQAKPARDKLVKKNISCNVDYSSTQGKNLQKLADYKLSICKLAENLIELKEQNVQLTMSLTAAEKRAIASETKSEELQRKLMEYQNAIISLTIKLNEKNENYIQPIFTRKPEKGTVSIQSESFVQGKAAQTQRHTMRNVTAEPVLMCDFKPAPKKQISVQTKPRVTKCVTAEKTDVSTHSEPCILEEFTKEPVLISDAKPAAGKKENVCVRLGKETDKTHAETKDTQSFKGGNESPLVRKAAAVTKESNKFKRFFESPTKDFCRLSNGQSNCWMNASVQAIANLQTVQTALQYCTREDLMRSPAIPSFSNFLLKVLNNPGRRFQLDEIFPVLRDISRVIPSLQVGRENDICDFLTPVLDWLEKCGVQSFLTNNRVSECNYCGCSSSSPFPIGNMAYMFMTQQQETTNTLLQRLLDDLSPKTCGVCQAETTTSNYLNSPDVVVLYLARGAVNRDLVLPDAILNVPQQTGTQTYNLSSVICHRNLSSRSAHFYTYVNYEDKIIKADDWRISVATTKDEIDMYKNGIIYIYEKNV